MKLLNDKERDVLCESLTALEPLLDRFARNASAAERGAVYGERFCRYFPGEPGASNGNLPLASAGASPLGNSWRAQRAVLAAWEKLPEGFPPEMVKKDIVPVCLRVATAGHVAAPVQFAAGRALCAILRRTRSIQTRNEIIQKILRELCHGKSFASRALFVRLCAGPLFSLFSRKFFRDHFLPGAVDRLSDPVPNVRLQVVPLLPALKRRVRLPEDAPLLERLSRALSELGSAHDRDVAAAVHLVAEDFRLLPTHSGSVREEDRKCVAPRRDRDGTVMQRCFPAVTARLMRLPACMIRFACMPISA